MRIIKGIAAGVAALTMALSGTANAEPMGQAETLRRLDIMLMVTGLRCRTTADNFQSDYGRFTTNHIDELNAASRSLKAELATRYGSAGAARALDRMSVIMANQYGQGHPWLSCRQLKQVAANLAQVRGSAALVAAADQLLGDGSSPQLAWARR